TAVRGGTGGRGPNGGRLRPRGLGSGGAGRRRRLPAGGALGPRRDGLTAAGPGRKRRVLPARPALRPVHALARHGAVGGRPRGVDRVGDPPGARASRRATHAIRGRRRWIGSAWSSMSAGRRPSRPGGNWWRGSATTA